jgi:protein gp37
MPRKAFRRAICVTCERHDLRDQCDDAGVACFLKQLDGHPMKRGGDAAVLDGERWTEMPCLTMSTS